MNINTAHAGALLAMMALAAPAAVFAEHPPIEHAETPPVEQVQEQDTHVDVPRACEFPDNLGRGSRGPAVACLQDLLLDSGDLDTIDVPTGYFGERTEAAVKKWQASRMLPETGYFGPLSRAKASAGAAAADVHDDEGLEADGWDAIPSVAVALYEDAMDGYNLEVALEHFVFAPERVNGAVAEGEGHAHVYVNGEKYARLYGPWLHLPADLFRKGDNTVRVTLNANSHANLLYQDEVIADEESVHID
jgi:peptidoglycan hydrolase-like protein with peptidoglycan-binding domain